MGINASSTMQRVILIAIALVIIAIILPIGLVYISEAGSTTVTINGSDVALEDSADPAILTLLTVLLPILVVVVIIMYFLPRSRES